MLGKEIKEIYRRMSGAERLQLTLEMIRVEMPYLLVGPPEVVERRFKLLEKQNDERNRLVLECLGRLHNRS